MQEMSAHLKTSALLVLDPFLNAIIVFVIVDVMNLYCPIYSALGYACDK